VPPFCALRGGWIGTYSCVCGSGLTEDTDFEVSIVANYA
jgi:hypothetical protein